MACRDRLVRDGFLFYNIEKMKKENDKPQLSLLVSRKFRPICQKCGKLLQN